MTADFRTTRAVALGGGHGLARALEALTRLGAEPTAVVTVADDGGSSGRLRRDLGIIAPGDLRMALLTLARNRALAGALEHRFQRGELEGHALGNLLLVALAEQAGGDFVHALEVAGRILDCAGRVLPATPEPVQLKARVAGQEIDGQVQVAIADGTIERVWIEPGDPKPCIEAVQALEEAELVILGPGSLFTSVIATLLVPGVNAALAASSARVVYVCNVTTQPGETSGFSVEDHLAALISHLDGAAPDAVVLHDGPIPIAAGQPLEPSLDDQGMRVVRADLTARDARNRPVAAHDPQRLAHAIARAVTPDPAG